MNETIPVRKGEELDPILLEEHLRSQFKEIPTGHLTIRQFGTGASNLTYTLNIGEWEAVLRRPPLGPVAPKAHDMDREYQVLKALNPLFPLAPKPLLYEDNKEITGAPFFLMERRHGTVIDTEFPEDFEITGEDCENLSEIMVDTLVDLHNVSYKGTRLEEISKPDGFMQRQVEGWIERYYRAKTDEINEIGRLTDWMEKHLPSKNEPTVIHYDYKLNNALFTKNLTKMTGLFDWEMATVGDPLADLGAAMSYWMEKDDPELLIYGMGKPTVTIRPEFYTRVQFIDRYAKKSGRDTSNIHYYLTFAYFKLAVICQQIYYRYKMGQTKDARFAKFGAFAETLIKHSLTIAQKG
ncbi:phosphotransferase family protein [Metabacillus sp. RGM 3146]|uniref:phosphotransferase family protein n=1 Tax=Metabacillus sp. RGM 3146 TaxID=3401092 RepID=UPI003B9D3C67